VVVADHAWQRALEIAWDAFCGGTTPVGAVVIDAASLAYAGADPYGGTGHLDFGIPQARSRPLRVAGPLPDERGRLAELLHIVFLIQRPAGPHVLAAQQSALPARFARAAHPATLRLFTDLAAARAPLATLRSALHALT
jgi:hypothetical protein